VKIIVWTAFALIGLALMGLLGLIITGTVQLI
jgi:hypothetical protein